MPGKGARAAVSEYQKLRVANFVAQFQPDGDGFFYRESMKGAPIRVTAAERQRYIEQFERSGRYFFWTSVAAGVLGAFALTFYFNAESKAPDWVVWTVVSVVLILLIVAFSYWTYHAPARDLRDRPRLGEPLAPVEVRKVSLRNLSYGQMAVAAAVLVFVTFGGRFGKNLSPEWKNIWLGFVGVLLAGLTFRAYQKWQLERGDTDRRG